MEYSADYSRMTWCQCALLVCTGSCIVRWWSLCRLWARNSTYARLWWTGKYTWSCRRFIVPSNWASV